MLVQVAANQAVQFVPWARRWVCIQMWAMVGKRCSLPQVLKELRHFPLLPHLSLPSAKVSSVRDVLYAAGQAKGTLSNQWFSSSVSKVCTWGIIFYVPCPCLGKFLCDFRLWVWMKKFTSHRNCKDKSFGSKSVNSYFVWIFPCNRRENYKTFSP